MLNETLLSTDGLSLSLRQAETGSIRPILSGIRLALREGESLAVVGPSGCGKSLLLRVLAGLLPPTSGTVRFLGQSLYPVRRSHRRELARHLGVAFQKGGLIDALTVYENLALPLREVTELGEGEIRERVTASLKAVGLEGTEALHPESLSGGMQKRLGVARAFLLADKVVILDDPTAGLDPVTAVAILDLVSRLQKEKGLAMVLVGSQPEEVLPLSDRVLFLVDGTVGAEGTPREMLAGGTALQSRFFERHFESEAP